MSFCYEDAISSVALANPNYHRSVQMTKNTLLFLFYRAVSSSSLFWNVTACNTRSWLLSFLRQLLCLGFTVSSLFHACCFSLEPRVIRTLRNDKDQESVTHFICYVPILFFRTLRCFFVFLIKQKFLKG